jgi:hypothetical protein
MADGQDCIQRVRETMEAAHGYHELGMYADAWTVLDDLPPEDKAHPIVMLLRLDILLGMDRWDDAVALGTGACRQWPVLDGFSPTNEDSTPRWPTPLRPDGWA